MLSRAPGDLHGRAAREIELFRRARAVGRDFEMVGAAEERAQLTLRSVGVRRDDLRDHTIADLDLELAAGELLERPPIDVRDQISEPIDAQHLADNPFTVDAGVREIEPVNGARRPAERNELDA